MDGALITFWIIAGLSVITALGVVLHKNPIRSALFLVINFVCLAIFYVFMNAQVLAALQILVYAGAIMVLFLFVIQLLNLGGELAPADPLVGQRLVGLLLGAGLLAGLGVAVNFAATHTPPPGVGAQRVAQAESAGVSQIQIIGYDLFTKYVYPFELTSILLLVGVIGVMILTKRRPAPGTTDATRS
ncbi:MAG: NADH-ubiquinone oxidoreductase chain [Armatimonadetes bacterium]|jgi:NADH-quinone oxidoreductase subunit J|nr:NADH-ubiquinone oxidoreductase chain [Armatimonadota bacterium]